MDTSATTRTETDAIRTIEELASAALRRIQRADQIPPRLLRIEDAATYLGTSDKAIRDLIVSGQLPYLQKVPGRSPYLIDLRDLDKWIESHKIRSS